MKFSEYNNNYKKEKYKQLKVWLKPEEKEKLDFICKKNNITQRQFVLNYIELLDKNNNIKD